MDKKARDIETRDSLNRLSCLRAKLKYCQKRASNLDEMNAILGTIVYLDKIINEAKCCSLTHDELNLKIDNLTLKVVSLYIAPDARCESTDAPSFNYYAKEFREMRLKVFLKQGEICAKCGATPSVDKYLTIDHIKPVSKFPGLAMEIGNLQVLCWECNKEKSNKHYTDYRK